MNKRKKKINKAVVMTTGLAIAMSTAVPTISTSLVVAQAGEVNTLIGNKNTSPYSFINGSSYWTTSSIREWLNGAEEKVVYTNDAPDKANLGSQSYSTEPGFLNGFTSEELEGVAVTERRAVVSSVMGTKAIEGGSSSVPRYDGLVASPFLHISSPNLHQIWKSLTYQTLNEKVFLLAPHEIYEYVQKRGNTFKKGITQEAKQQFNISKNTHQYLTSSYNYSNGNGEAVWAIDEQGNGTSHSTITPSGIAPALHLKANYILPDGRKAKDLAIGEVLSFGSYNHASIEWRVINVTPEGNPLLWAEKVLTIKRFDAPGDTIYRNSTSVQFQNADISIKNDLKFTNGQKDLTVPTIKVSNEEELFKRQNNSFSLQIEASDTESGVDYIICPNGDKVYSNLVSYEVSQNGRYYFTAVDKAGNHYGFEVPVGNINPPANVVIKTSANGWTNKDVTVDISTTEAGTTWEMASVKNSLSAPIFPEFTSYAGKQFKITGKVRLVSAVDTRFNAVVRLMYDKITEFDTNYYVARNYPSPVSIPLSTLSTETYTSFEETYVIPGDYFGKLQPGVSTTASGINSKDYQIEWKDLKVELLDRDDFKIDKIILPNGEEVLKNAYKDVLKEEGTYTYQVVDNRGKVTEKVVEVKIDKKAPIIEISGNPKEVTNKDVVINVVSSDLQSGVKQIQKPNGEWVNASSLTYNVYENGTYTFKVEDYAGNIATKSIVVSEIDKTAPSQPTLTPSEIKPTNQNVVITINYDSDSEENQYRVNNGEWIDYSEPISFNQNGQLEARSTDAVGNTSLVSIYEVKNIDKVIPIKPTFDVKGNLNKFSAIGEKGAVLLYRSNNQLWMTYSGEVQMEDGRHTLEFKSVDDAGNVSEISIAEAIMYAEALNQAIQELQKAELDITIENINSAYEKVNAVPKEAPEYKSMIERLNAFESYQETRKDLEETKKAIEEALKTRNVEDVEKALKKISLLNSSSPLVIEMMTKFQQDIEKADILALVTIERYDLLKSKYGLSNEAYASLVQSYYAEKYTGEFMYKRAGENVTLVPITDKHYDLVQEQYASLIVDYEEFIDERITTESERKAKDSVSIAESRKLSYYVTSAYKLVNSLTNEELKASLTERLVDLERIMILEKEIASATQLVEMAEKYKLKTSIANAESKVLTLPTSEAKELLQARLDALTSGFPTVEQSTIISKAKNALSLAQSLKKQTYIDKAQTAIDLVEDQKIKEELQRKLDEIVAK